MTIVQRLERELDRAVRRALRKHGTIRAAATSIGMPRATFFERACKLGLAGAPRKKVRRGR